MLQEEIENATKEAFQKVCCINRFKPRFNTDTVSAGSETGWSRDQQPPQPASYCLDVSSPEEAHQGFFCPEKEALEKAVQDYSQHGSELQRQLSESHDHREQQRFGLRRTILQLQTELQQVNVEKDFLSNLRMKDSRRHTGEMECLQRALRDLQTTRRFGEKKLRQAEEEARALARKAECAEGAVREVYSALMAHRRGGSRGELMPVGQLAVEVLEDLEQECDQLKEGLAQVLEKQKTEELSHQARVQVMLNEHQDRMEQVSAMEQQLSQAQADKAHSEAQVDEARRGRERSLKQVEELRSQLARLTEELLQAKEEQGREKEHGRLLQDRSTALQAAVEDLRKDLEDRGVLAHQLHSLLGTVKQDGLAQMEALRSREQRQRCELQEEASMAEQGCRVQELTQEREQLSAQLDHQRTQMLSLTEDQEALRRLRGEREEQQGVVQQLRGWLRSLKVARGMQRQVTAGRQEVDALQSRIQQLEETMETLQQEKRCQGTGFVARELASIREQKRQLAVELEALRSSETRHKNKVQELETALHQMSESFADCRDILQLREQESVGLKLRHALDVQELQGHSLGLATAIKFSLQHSCVDVSRSRRIEVVDSRKLHSISSAGGLQVTRPLPLDL
ncbi:hypothetical protein NHX12_029069 [Muraenolepis orangiensis]|uniref:Uncharacterized protein n=1 Tax=Muraenolepis orangiensis TaxID=630683 RepID=A0A9Q0EDC7_9TELE|nr:hypothetical protein NHX12_029069 [Muraenolepis orangiensis]